MTSTGFPTDYVPFKQVRESLPEPTLVQASETVTLETLHFPNPAPVIAFVHGGLGSLWNPYPQLNAFDNERGLVPYALAGNGNSSPRPEQSLDGHVTDLENLLDELDIDRPIVHGHSYGTAIAIEYAKRYPTSGLVLHGGGDHDLTPMWEKPLLRLGLALRLYRLPTNDALTHQLAHRVGFHDATPRAVVEDFLRSNPTPRRRSAWTTVTEAFWDYDGRSDSGWIDVPTLVIHGPGDGIVPIDVARGTAERLPDSIFCRVERTGHVAMAERPAMYNRLLRAVVEAIRTDRSLEASVRDHLGGNP
jgi:pimeloyl-ACP methyl ester carboxylesterase